MVQPQSQHKYAQVLAEWMSKEKQVKKHMAKEQPLNDKDLAAIYRDLKHE